MTAKRSQKKEITDFFYNTILIIHNNMKEKKRVLQVQFLATQLITE